jgi:hypothetical protein
VVPDPDGAAEAAAARAEAAAAAEAAGRGVTLSADQLEQIGDRAAERVVRLFELQGAFSRPEPPPPPAPPGPESGITPDDRPVSRSFAARFLGH